MLKVQLLFLTLTVVALSSAKNSQAGTHGLMETEVCLLMLSSLGFSLTELKRSSFLALLMNTAFRSSADVTPLREGPAYASTIGGRSATNLFSGKLSDA